MQREEKREGRGGGVGVQASTMSTLMQYSDTKSWGGLLSEYISHIIFFFLVIISTKEVLFSPVSVCLPLGWFVSRLTQKLRH